MKKPIEIPTIREILQDLSPKEDTDNFIFKIASAFTQRVARQRLRCLGYNRELEKECKLAFLEIIRDMCE